MIFSRLQNVLIIFRMLFRRSKKPLISIVIPYYNDSKYINECLNSISWQFYKNHEVIIVNDKSEQAEREYLDKISNKNIRIIDHKVNLGLASTRNTGIQDAKGKYILFLDSDDFIFPFSLLLRVYYLERLGRKSDVAGSFAQMFSYPDGKRIGVIKRLRTVLSYKPTGRKHFLQAEGQCPFPVHAPLVKMEVVRKFKGFDSSMRHGAEDWDFWYRLLRHGYEFISAHHVGSAYRQKANSMVRAMSGNHLEEALNLYEKAYSGESVTIEGTPFFYSKSIHDYNYVKTISPRLFNFIAMINFSKGEYSTIEGFLERNISKEMIPFYLEKVNIDKYLEDGIRRFYLIPRYRPLTTALVDKKQVLLKKITETLKSRV